MSDSQSLEHSHEPQAISERLSENKKHSYLRDFIYGATDGIVTTFAIVTGVAGAKLGHEVIVVLGAANLIADGFSMAASNYLGTRTDEQLRENARQMEISHIRLNPEGEREEIRQIFAAKGFEGEELENAVDVITRNQEQWVNTMLVDEHGLTLEGPSPTIAALTTFWAFVAVGLLPLLPFILFGLGNVEAEGAANSSMFVWSSVMTAIAFFLVGASKSFFVSQSWLRSGLETLAIGSGAAAIAYWIGYLLHQMVGNPLG